MEPYQLILWIVIGIVTAFIAKSRGRNPLGWFLVGAFFSCLGLIMLLVLPDLAKEKAKADADRRRRRRLEEELAQERMKNQAFRSHVGNRLDAHDEALAIDTKSGAPTPLPPPPTPAPLDPGLPEEGWYLALPGEAAEGPFELDELRDRIHDGSLVGKTLVWHESLEDWMEARRSPLKDLLP